jgi:hypothetical protein
VPAQRLVGDDAERVDVGLRPGAVGATELLGGHVGVRAEGRVQRRQPAPGLRVVPTAPPPGAAGTDRQAVGPRAEGVRIAVAVRVVLPVVGVGAPGVSVVGVGRELGAAPPAGSVTTCRSAPSTTWSATSTEIPATT